ncbi:hypothetical protein [Escherichia sp. TW09308]|uniref:hypothetical protein n=1 Tax=Escherichia sp. TW09308 TaxID=754331 RepID=UPI00111076F1|nr:hypothetical protein [Escherichia sp. TW09308]
MRRQRETLHKMVGTTRSTCAASGSRALMLDATLCASYQAYGLRAKCRLGEALVLHPVAVH